MEVEQVLESARKAKAADRRVSVWARRGRIPTNAICLPGTNGAGGKSDGAGGVYDAGTLSESQAQRLANAGLDYYNTTSTPRRSFTAISSPRVPIRTPRYAGKSARRRDQSLFRRIVGLGETVKDRAGLLLQLANCQRRRKAYQSTCW